METTQKKSRSELVMLAVLWLFAAGATAFAVAVAADMRIPQGAVIDVVSVEKVEGSGCKVYERYLPPSKFRDSRTLEVSRCESLIAVKSDSTGDVTAMEWFADHRPSAGEKIDVWYPQGAFDEARQVEHPSIILWLIAGGLLLGAIWASVSVFRASRRT